MKLYKKEHRKQYVGLLLFLFMVGVNILSWQSERFSSWYQVHIFPLWVNALGRFFSLFSFSVGEKLILVGILILLIGVILLVVLAFFHRHKSVRNIVKHWWSGVAWIVLIVLWVQTLNCFILYHSKGFASQYVEENTHKPEELIPLYNHIVEQANALSGTFERDEEGYLKIDETEFGEQAAVSLQALSNEYPQLGGYYPEPKSFLFSDFVSQQNLMGMYFPFSMEANINSTMYVLNRPFVMCHELSHLKGYMQEEEANYIAYLACVQSKDTFFQYSGYRNVLNYVANDIVNNLGTDKSITDQLEKVNEQVYQDNIFLKQEDWERINEEALVDTETVKKTYQTAADTSMKLNGVKDGIASYNRVVDLMLDYYEEKGEFED